MPVWGRTVWGHHTAPESTAPLPAEVGQWLGGGAGDGRWMLRWGWSATSRESGGRNQAGRRRLLQSLMKEIS